MKIKEGLEMEKEELINKIKDLEAELRILYNLKSTSNVQNNNTKNEVKQ